MEFPEMMRQIRLPRDLSGNLFLHNMPRRYERLLLFWEQVRAQRINAIISLTNDEENCDESPEYRTVISSNEVPSGVMMTRSPISEYTDPETRNTVWAVACEIARNLREGQNILIHCAGGEGRTGMLAECVLLALGQDGHAAYGAVRDAECSAEAKEQRDLITWCAAQRGKSGTMLNQSDERQAALDKRTKDAETKRKRVPQSFLSKRYRKLRSCWNKKKAQPKAPSFNRGIRGWRG